MSTTPKSLNWAGRVNGWTHDLFAYTKSADRESITRSRQTAAVTKTRSFPGCRRRTSSHIGNVQTTSPMPAKRQTMTALFRCRAHWPSAKSPVPTNEQLEYRAAAAANIARNQVVVAVPATHEFRVRTVLRITDDEETAGLARPRQQRHLCFLEPRVRFRIGTAALPAPGCRRPPGVRSRSRHCR